MLDRASSLADAEVLKLISTRFVPVAIDQHVHRTLNDAEGELFGKILKQAGRGLESTSQGNYLFSPDGTLLAFANTADAAHVKQLLATALKRFDPAAPALLVAAKAMLPQFQLPEGGLVINVTAKVLGGYDKTVSQVRKHALGHDHLWLRKDEVDAIINGELPGERQTADRAVPSCGQHAG